MLLFMGLHKPLNNSIFLIGYLGPGTNRDASAFVASLGTKMLGPSHEGNAVPPVDVVTLPSSASKSYAGMPVCEEEKSLSFSPMYLTGIFKDYDMSLKQFVHIVMPSGIKDHKEQVTYGLTGELDGIELDIIMPDLMTDSYRLHSDTLPANDRLMQSSEEINRNVRVMTYNAMLSELGHEVGKPPLKWRANVKLPRTACVNKFERRKWKKDRVTGCLILCLDILVEDSNYLKVDEEDSVEEL